MPGAGDRTLFVGRDAELRRLHAAFDDAAAGHGALALVVGEPGIGKTALCNRFAAEVPERGGRVLTGHCYEDVSLPYLPFVEALRAFNLAAEPERLQQLVGASAADVARLIPELRDLLGVQPERPSDPEGDRYRLLQAVTDFLRRLAVDRPLLLVLEDLHDADRGTLDLLLHVGRQIADARLLLVGTYRDVEVDRAHPLSATLAELRRVGPVERVRLGGLTPDETWRVLHSIAGAELPQTLTEAVYRQTEGHPLFVQEVARSFAGEGSVFGTAMASGSAPAALRIPEAVRDVIGGRLSRLSPACNRLLEIAAVIGHEFALDTLAWVAGDTEDAVVDALDEAVKAGVLVEQVRTGPVRYRFGHALFRQALYEELRAPRRVRLHQQAGRVLEAAYAGRLDEHAAELAEHFARSTQPQDLAKAVHFSTLAAQQAISVFAYTEAVRLLDRALELQRMLAPGDKEARHELLVKLGEALIAAGESDRVLTETAPAALALAEAMNDRRRAFAACRLVLDGTRNVFTEPDWLERARRYAGEDREARTRVNIRVSSKDLHEGHFSEARALLTEALTLARQDGYADLEFAAVSFMLRIGVLSAGEERRLFDELRNRPREGFNVLDRSSLQFDAVATHLQWGERQDAERERLSLAALAARTRHRLAAQYSAGAEALFATLDGRLHEALALSAAATIGTFPHVWRGRLAGWLGDTAVLEQELVWSRDFTAWSYYGPAQTAFCLAHLGRFEEARETLSMITSRLAEHTEQHGSAYSLLNLVLEAAALSRDTTALGLLLEWMRDDPRRLAKPHFSLVPRHLGRAAALLGRAEDAKALYVGAIDFCTRVRHRPELALVRLDLAELLLEHFPAERAAAEVHLDAATAEFEDMQMRPAVARALALRKRCGSVPSSASPAVFPGGLTEREVEVLRLIASGRTSREIAEALVLSVRTVDRHLANIYAKTGAANRAQAAAYAVRHGLLAAR